MLYAVFHMTGVNHRRFGVNCLFCNGSALFLFFHFLMEVNPVYQNYSISQFTLSDLENLEPVDIEEYMEYKQGRRPILNNLIYRNSYRLKLR